MAEMKPPTAPKRAARMATRGLIVRMRSAHVWPDDIGVAPRAVDIHQPTLPSTKRQSRRPPLQLTLPVEGRVGVRVSREYR